MKKLIVLLAFSLLGATAFADRNDRGGRGGNDDSRMREIAREEIRDAMKNMDRGGGRGGRDDIRCNWHGSRWVSHGFDGPCAWQTGMFVTCHGGQVTSIDYDEAGGCSTQKRR